MAQNFKRKPPNMKMRHYLVLFTPRRNDGLASTINHMKVVDAWSTTGDIAYSRKLAVDRRGTYRTEHGEGHVYVVQTNHPIIL